MGQEKLPFNRRLQALGCDKLSYLFQGHTGQLLSDRRLLLDKLVTDCSCFKDHGARCVPVLFCAVTCDHFLKFLKIIKDKIEPLKVLLGLNKIKELDKLFFVKIGKGNDILVGNGFLS